MPASPFLRQFYVALSPLLAAISAGGAVCYPSVLLQQLKAKDSPIQLDFETASWMGSIHGLAGIPSIFAPCLMQWRGRKFVFIVTCIIIIIGWVVAYFAADATTLLIAESFHGLGTSSLLTVSCLTITELISPQYRDACMQLFLILETMSMAAEGAISQHYHWKTISIVMAVPIVVSLVLACTSPESPYWLAYKGDYTKCENNFTWLRGSDVAAKKELNELIHKPINNVHALETRSKSNFWKTIVNKEFLVPAVHVIILQFLIYGSGTIVMLIYPIVILQKLTSNNQISDYGGLIANLLLCTGICIGIISDRYFKKKITMLWSIFCAVLFMLLASAFSYLQSVGVWPHESFMGLYCLSGIMLSSGFGIIGLAQNVGAALLPVKHRGLGGALMAINTGVFHSGTLKSAPYMFLYLDMWGTFLMYATLSLVCGLLIWRYVPEIKDRSLQEIENYYKYGKYSRIGFVDVESTNILPKPMTET